MAIDVQKALLRATDVARFLPTPQDLLRPFPRPKHGFIPWVGDIAGDFVEDNIIADVETRLTPEERTEFREQNRVYPNGIALVRTFQRTRVAPGSGR